MNKKANIDDIVEKGLILFGFAFASVLGVLFLTHFNDGIQSLDVDSTTKTTISDYVNKAPQTFDYAFMFLIIIVTIFSIVMASIIEAETGLVDERQMVSSVYHNRLTRNMKLDADPTVIYGLGGLERQLYRKDLKKDTPYNTYMKKGLPPTPINSPGLAAIRAAIHPEESDYLFFVADNTGRHYFSRTNAEHNRAIRRIRSGN